MKNYQLIEFLK